MSAKRILGVSASSSLFIADPSRRVHLRHAQDLGHATVRFEAFQAWLTSAGALKMEPASLVLGCLISLDGIVATPDLRSAYACCSQGVRVDGAHRLDWTAGSRFDARHVSGWTTLAIARVLTWPSFEVAQECLLQALAHCGLTDALPTTPESTWDQLLRATMGWLQVHLPPVLFCHVSGVAPLTALPRSALVRAQTQRALRPEAVNTESGCGSPDQIYPRAFEAALLGSPASARSGAAFIQQLLAALRPAAKGSNASKRADISRRVRTLAANLDNVDETCALLYLFSLDLVENGTRRKKDLAPTTPSNYLQAFANDVHIALDGVRLYGIDEENYDSIFRKLLDQAGAARVAGLKAFHLFLRAWWQVPQLSGKTFQVDVETKVRANLIWPHEMQTLRQWITQTPCSRFVAQLHTALELAFAAPVRIGELLVLRLHNVVDEGAHLVVEIARELRDGREKSHEGRRRVTIRDAVAMATLRSWLARRHSELAASEDYVFGEPSRANALAHAGRMYFWLNQLLKSVTGDDSISLHALRHGYASQRLASLLQGDTDGEVNPLDQLANEVGHIGGHVTAVNYCHLHESGLRHAIDRGLRRLSLDYTGATAWTGVTSDTLRQRASRAAKRGISCTDVLWNALKSAARAVTLPAVEEHVPVVTSSNPLQTLRPQALSFSQVMGVLLDVSKALSTHQAALRHGVTPDDANQMVEVVGEFAERHGKAPPLMTDLLSLGIEALQQQCGQLLGMRPDFDRARQQRWITLATAIGKMEPSLLRQALVYWRRALAGTHLAVRPGSAWDAFLALLASSELSRSLMSLRWSATDDRHDEVADLLAQAQVSVRHRLGRYLPQARCAYRPGRPHVWLIIGSDSRLLGTDGSANSLVGLHCTLLAAHVWQSMNSTEGGI